MTGREGLEEVITCPEILIRSARQLDRMYNSTYLIRQRKLAVLTKGLKNYLRNLYDRNSYKLLSRSTKILSISKLNNRRKYLSKRATSVGYIPARGNLVSLNIQIINTSSDKNIVDVKAAG